MSQNQPAIENIIPPEIKNDALYNLIVRLCSTERLTHVLEIGSSSGGGSTEAFVRGLSQNPGTPSLYCLEISKTRFQKLAETYRQYGFVKTYNASSVGSDNLPSPEQVREFYNRYKLPLRHYPVEEVLKWLQGDRDYIESNAGVEPEGIELIKKENGIETFDLVLIDGSEFLGSAELDRVYGAKYILLDDTRAYKTFECRERLLNDPRYELMEENPNLRNGYSAFRLREAREGELPVHFFTIVLNGMPFIEYHIEMMKSLPFKWVWHIVEGVADLVNDTAWSRASGGHVPEDMHRNGLSNDGTSEYIEELARRYPENVKVYRKGDGQFWNGKKEMCNAALSGVKEECLLWQLDNDELWTAGQVAKMRDMFLADPERGSAFFWCWFFFGPDRIICTRNCYAENPNMEWLRVWRFRPGMVWAAHEPPSLVWQAPDGRMVNQGRAKPFMHAETEAAGLVFQHFAYATKEQVRFKERYYGYKGAVQSWERLQTIERLPVQLNGVVPWVRDGAAVDLPGAMGVDPVAAPAPDGSWKFRYTHRDAGLEVIEGNPNVLIDGAFFQYYHTGIARVWTSLLKEWSGTDFARRLVVLDRGGTMAGDRVLGITYQMGRRHNYGDLDAESSYLDYVCHNFGVGACISTYYSHTKHTPYVMLVHDMIPELNPKGYNLNEPMWVEKTRAISVAKQLVCVSQSTATDLMRLHPELDGGRVSVASNGLSGRFRRPPEPFIERFRRRYGLIRPYYMLSGARGSYKNGISLFRAFNKFPAHNAFEIFCSGPQPLNTQELDLADGSPVVQAKLDDMDLVSAYAGAVALVVPSFYEGFGLPVLEAMACGCPVISSNRTSLPEVAGDAALLFDPANADQLSDCMAEVLKPSVRARMIAAGYQRADEFSWKKMADKLRGILEAVADGKQQPARAAVPAAGPDIAGRMADAVAKLDDLADASHLSPSMMNDRAVAHYRLAKAKGDKNEALKAMALLSQLTGDHPDFLNAWKNTAVIGRAVGDSSATRKALENIERIAPDDPDIPALRNMLASAG